jgi:hypothetical protein
MELSTLLLLLPTIVFAAGLVATAISKVTANTTDDKIAAWLVALHDLLIKLVPSGATLAQKRAPAPELPPVVRSKP